jgi:hypothetical protein
MRLEGLGQLKNPRGNRTRDIPACSIMLQTNYATAHPHYFSYMDFFTWHFHAVSIGGMMYLQLLVTCHLDSSLLLFG